MSRWYLYCCCVVSFAAVPWGLAAEVLALGHPDRQPSPEHPIAWRGDGSGAWPGASVVTSWDAGSGDHIVWKLPMPAPSFAQPIVVGSKVITLADPDLVLCVDVHSGSVDWTTQIDHTTVMAPQQAAEARKDRQFVADLRRDFGRWLKRRAALDAQFQNKHKIDLAQVQVLAAGAKELAAQEKAKEDIDLDLGDDDDDDELDEDREHGPLMGLNGRPLDAGLVKQFRDLMAERAQNAYVLDDKYGKGIRVKVAKGKQPTAVQKRLHRANRQYDIYVTDHWAEPWTTFTFATPVCDGEAIYVATSNNAVARVLLDGSIDWLVWEHKADRERGAFDASYGGAGIGTRFCPSPLLMDGKLIVNHNGELRVYDATTGKKLWSKWNPYNKTKQFPWRPQPESITPATTWLDVPGGGRLAVMTDGGGRLYRLDDGKVLSKELAGVTWVSPVMVRDLYHYRSSGPLVKTKRGVQRLRALSRDEVQVETLWSIPSGGGGSGARCATDVVHNGRIFLNNRYFNPLTGDSGLLDSSLANDALDTGNRSAIIVGAYQYSLGWTEAWVFPLAGGPVIHSKHAFDDTRPADDLDWHERWSWTGQMQHSSPSAQANRFFVRSRAHLWCIGDASQPFPAGRP